MLTILAGTISMDDLDQLLDEQTAAELIGLTPRFLQARRQRGGGPPYVSISRRCIRYRRSDLEGWINDRVRSSTSEHRPTLLCDEYDAFIARDEDLRSAMNAGHRRGGRVTRCVGDNHEVKAFPVFAPVALV